LIWTRRQFLTRTSAGIVLAATPVWDGPWRSPMLHAAIVGLGSRGRRHVAAGLLPGVELARLCDVDGAALRDASSCCRSWLGRDVPASPLLADVLADANVHAVVVAVPVEQRARIARLAIEAGKHVYCEPPWAVDAAEGSELLAVAARRQRLLWQGTVETSWQAHVVDQFLDSRLHESHIVVRRGSAPASSVDWSHPWLDALASLTARVREVSPATKALNVRTPFGARADVAFTSSSGAVRSIVLSESPSFNRAVDGDWTIALETPGRISELWIGLRTDTANAPDPQVDLAGWRPFLECLQRRDAREWRRVADAQQRANNWLQSIRMVAA
jgi:Oxidoreductase family, NAD-binding Rossmann fold